jgi:hypothetical protein
MTSGCYSVSPASWDLHTLKGSDAGNPEVDSEPQAPEASQTKLLMAYASERFTIIAMQSMAIAGAACLGYFAGIARDRTTQAPGP